MNDRHGVPPNGIAKEHPEWALFGGAYDYALEPVRKAMLDFNQEVLDGYDVDGIEYDYMRWCHMFKPGEGKRDTHLLTDFTRRTRKQLDEAAKRRGRGRLVLGVRVTVDCAERPEESIARVDGSNPQLERRFTSSGSCHEPTAVRHHAPPSAEPARGDGSHSAYACNGQSSPAWCGP